MECPYCTSFQTGCTDSRQYGEYRKRRYRCRACGERFNTVEMYAEAYSELMDKANADATHEGGPSCLTKYIKLQAAKAVASVIAEDKYNHRQVEAAMDSIPVEDVRPVVRGYWKPVRESEISGYDPALSGQDPIYMHLCSNCGIESYLDENGEELLTAFCPMCGADMREVQDDD